MIKRLAPVKTLAQILSQSGSNSNPKKPFEYAEKLEWCPEVKGFVFYALMLSNGDIYRGYTAGFKQRMLNHFNGRGCNTTKINKPVYIHHYEVFGTKKEALDRERYFKTVGRQELRRMVNPKSIKPC